MMIGFFEGIGGIAWRVADSLTLRQFLGIGLDERTPDHVTISRTRRMIEEGTHPGGVRVGAAAVGSWWPDPGQDHRWTPRRWRRMRP
jgi:hypothetical protein